MLKKTSLFSVLIAFVLSFGISQTALAQTTVLKANAAGDEIKLDLGYPKVSTDGKRKVVTLPFTAHMVNAKTAKGKALIVRANFVGQQLLTEPDPQLGERVEGYSAAMFDSDGNASGAFTFTYRDGKVDQAFTADYLFQVSVDGKKTRVQALQPFVAISVQFNANGAKVEKLVSRYGAEGPLVAVKR